MSEKPTLREAVRAYLRVHGGHGSVWEQDLEAALAQEPEDSTELLEVGTLTMNGNENIGGMTFDYPLDPRICHAGSWPLFINVPRPIPVKSRNEELADELVYWANVHAEQGYSKSEADFLEAARALRAK